MEFRRVLCRSDTFTLPSATVDPTTATITYEEITGGTSDPVADPSFPITKPLGIYTYLVTATNDTCASSVTIMVSVTDQTLRPPCFNRIYNDDQSFDTVRKSVQWGKSASE